MIKSKKYRSLISLAVLRLSESDLRYLHSMVTRMSPISFLELIRDIEDEIDNSMALIMERATERAIFDPGATELYKKIDHIRRKELRVPVLHFADMLTDSLSNVSREQGVEIPGFQPRRGLEAWIGRLSRAFSEQDVFHAAILVQHKLRDQKNSDWKLR